MNDLNQIAPNTSLRLHPDDTTMYTADTSAACSAAVFLIRICNQRYHSERAGLVQSRLSYNKTGQDASSRMTAAH